MKNLDYFEGLAARLAWPLRTALLGDRHTVKLCEALLKMLPDKRNLSGLDVGCGSGLISKRLEEARPDVHLVGADILIRPETFIPTVEFDGKRLPFADKSYDFVMLIDVLHHADNQSELLAESARVASQFLLIKDHISDSAWDESCLKFMDWVGNRAHGVELPYNYLSTKEWQALYKQCRLTVETEVKELDLYGQPLGLVFDRDLHFLAKLHRENI